MRLLHSPLLVCGLAAACSQPTPPTAIAVRTAALSATPSRVLELGVAGSKMGDTVAAAGDVNGDGHADALVGTGGSSLQRLFLGSPTGLALSGWSASGYAAKTAGDVNGDGYADVLVGGFSGAGGGQVRLYLGSASGLASSSVWSVDAPSRVFGAGFGSAGDVNGDGFAEIIIGAPDSNAVSGSASVYLGSASGPSPSAQWTVVGPSGSYFGWGVGRAGDVNGDGYSDVVVGAPLYSNGQAEEGAAFVYLGSASGLAQAHAWMVEGGLASVRIGVTVASAGDVDADGYADVLVGTFGTGVNRALLYRGSVSGPSATADWSVDGTQADAHFGEFLDGAGDLNGDGYADVIVSAWTYDNGASDTGRAYVYLGSASGLPSAASLVLDATAGQASDYLGYSIAGVGDIDADGFSDFLVGAPNRDDGITDQGAVFVYAGGAAAPPTALGQAFATFEADQAGAELGSHLQAAGDLNGDGFGDFAIGAHIYDTPNGANTGRVWVYYGSASGLGAPTTIDGDQGLSLFGFPVVGAGDLNGDGYGELVVGAPSYSDGQADEGEVVVYFGSASGISAANKAVLQQNQPGAWFGYSLAAAGDVNGDGRADLLVGARLYDSNGFTNNGAAFLYLGTPTGVGATPTMMTVAVNGAQFGYPLAGLGDVNGDGFGDVAVGGYIYANGQTDEGVAHVYYGSSGGLLTSAPVVLEGNQANAYFGAVSRIGDIDGDGYDDLAVGASEYDDGETDEGAVFIYRGSATGIATTPSAVLEKDVAGLKLGGVEGIGDIDGDGFADVAGGSRFYGNGQADEGIVWFWRGSSAGLVASSSAIESNVAATGLAFVTAVGDIDGDGDSDFVLTAQNASNGEVAEGKAWLFAGHGGRGAIAYRPRQMRAATSKTLLGDATVRDASSIQLSLFARATSGRTRVKMQYELVGPGEAFSVARAQRSPSWVDTGVAGATVTVNVTPPANQATRWRARLVYADGGSSSWQVYDRVGVPSARDVTVAGSTGGSSALIVTDGDVGDACTSGSGVRIISGLDNGDGGAIAHDGVLQYSVVAVGDGEIDAIAIVCDGDDALVALDANVESACDAFGGHGGQRIRSGLDDGAGGGSAGDHVLQDGEVDSTAYVCNGADGADGTDGTNGTNGFNTIVVSDATVDTHCAAFGDNGGVRIQMGLDDGLPTGVARNNTLEPGEVEATTYVCNGADGASGAAGPVGANGFNGLVVQDADVTTHCDAYGNGGTRIRSGLDDGLPTGQARNGLLDDGEVDTTTYVCNGADGPMGATGATGTPGAAGHATVIVVDADVGDRCDAFGNGGSRVRSGLDDGTPSGIAGDRVLQPGEATDSWYVCNGADGLDGAPGADGLIIVDEGVGPACDGRAGVRVRTGRDNGAGTGTAGDDRLDDLEIETTAYVCDGAPGDDGHSSITQITRDDDGCESGSGFLVEAGVDDGAGGATANDGVLSGGEATFSGHVCDGTAGAAAHALLVEYSDDVGVLCGNPSRGGKRLLIGSDDGAPDGEPDDGQLDPAEVDNDAIVICYGEPGNGHDAIVDIEPDDGTFCEGRGGFVVRHGVDDGLSPDGEPSGTADDGVLSPGERDGGEPEFVCDGKVGQVVSNGCDAASGRVSLLLALIALVMVSRRARRVAERG